MKVHILDSYGSGLNKILDWLSENVKVSELSLYKNPDTFLEKVEKERPEIVLIRLGNNNIPGLKIGKMVNMMDENIRIVFVSNEKDYAIDAYEVGAYGYLLCPVEKAKLDKCLSNIGTLN